MYLMQSSTASVLCESMVAGTWTALELATGTAAGTCCFWRGRFLFIAMKCRARVTLSARCFRKHSGENCSLLSDLGDGNLHFWKVLLPVLLLLDEFGFLTFCSNVVVMELEERSEPRVRERKRERERLKWNGRKSKAGKREIEKCSLPTKLS